MTKVAANIRIDSELLALAKARSKRDGITLIALLEGSLRASLGVSAPAAPSDQTSVEALVKTVVENMLDEIERVKVNIINVETSVNTNTQSVKTIRSEVAGLSDKISNVSATVDTIVNTNIVDTIVKTIVNTNDDIDGSGTSPADTSTSEDWVNLATVAAALGVLPKSISGACTRRGRDIGNDTIEFDMVGRKIHKKGSGVKATYMLKVAYNDAQKSPAPTTAESTSPVSLEITANQAKDLQRINDRVGKVTKARIKKLIDLDLIIQIGDDLILTKQGETSLSKICDKEID